MHTSTELLSFSQIAVSDYSLKTSSLYPLKLKFLLYHPVCFKEFVSEHKSHIKHMPSCNFWKHSPRVFCALHNHLEIIESVRTKPWTVRL